MNAALLATLALLAQADTGHWSATWIVGRSDPALNSPVQAWLALTDSGPAPDSLEIYLLTPTGVEAGVGTCPLTSVDTVWAGAAPGPIVLPVCLVPTDRAAYRILAQVRWIGSTPEEAGSRSVASDPIQVQGRWYWPPGPMAMALLAALLGFVGGIGTPYVNERIKSSTEQRRQDRDARAAIVTSLMPELTANREALRRYLETQGATPPDLTTEHFDTTFAEGGPVSVLGGPDRHAWFGEIGQLYRGLFNAYRHAKNQNDPDVEGRARAALAALQRLIG